MKKILVFLFLAISFTSFGQSNMRFKFPDTRVISDLNGQVIDRGDEFNVFVSANGNGDTQTRQLLFDLQFDKTNFDLISITHTGTISNGGILPQNSNPQISFQNYPGYGYAGNVTTTDGTVRYQTAGYTYDINSSNSIIRAVLTWASNSGISTTNFDNLLVVRFRVKASSTANLFDPVKLNFVAGWNGNGQMVPTILDNPLSTDVILNQNTGKFVTAKVDLNTNLSNLSNLRVAFRDTVKNTIQGFPLLSNGNVDINQSLLTENTVYEVFVQHETDKLNNIYNGAITVSDFTSSQNEFLTMGLAGTKGTVINTGQSLYAADINKNKNIDAGDLPKLLAQIVGIDNITTVPAGYTQGSGGYMSLPTWVSTDATSLAGQTEWVVLSVNHYSQGSSRVLIDMREFNNTNVIPENIKSLQLLDLFDGPVEFVSKDATWATYKVPSSFSTIASTVFLPYVRLMNPNEYGIKTELSFNVTPAFSWGSITTTNWKDLTFPKVIIKTGVSGSNTLVNLKYLVWGDVNRSHSSQVVVSNNGIVSVVSRASNSLKTNTNFKTSAIESFINTPNVIPSINVNLSNLTVTSNSVEIPINVTGNGNSIGALQFEFTYDPTKLKFEELTNNLPNTWYVFVNSLDGKLKFGALDQENKTPVTGTSTPFKLKFSTIGNGLDILTSIKVSSNMDASDNKGNQLGINLNNTQIKLTGYNNF
jgi:hypothetical protein